MIGIRADANTTIALGHIMRCIAIAEQIEEKGEEVIFLTADHFSDEILQKKGFNNVCLETDWLNKDSESDKMQEAIKKLDITILLIDSYEVTKNYLIKLHELVKIVYIDDLYSFEYSADMVINYTHKVKSEIYKNYVSDSVKFLLGSKFVPLRKEFQNRSILIKQEITDVLITTGGSDPYQIIYKLLQKLNGNVKWSNIQFHIVVGQFFTNVNELEDLCCDHNIILHKNVKNMAEIMLQCDIAISAGGTTLSELCACGVPTICFAFADNQLEGVASFGDEKIMLSVGDIRIDIAKSINCMIEMLEKMKDNVELRQAYSTTAKSIIDGNGAKRITEQILKL